MESTAIEHDDWIRVLRDLDSNLLMSPALGHTCHFYDCGTRREVSKTVSVGVPFVRTFLRQCWVERHPWRADTQAARELKRKLGYFRRYLATDEIRLVGHSMATEHDGDVAFYAAAVGCRPLPPGA